MSHAWPQAVDLFTRVGAGALLNGLWQSVALAVLAWLILRAMPRANASIRYMLWVAALVGVVALPLTAMLHASVPAPPAAAGAPIALPQQLAIGLLIVWYAVATVLVMRLVISYARLQRLKAIATPLPLFYQHRVRRWLEACGGKRACRLCISDQVSMPLAVGLLDPVVVLPSRLVAQLSDEELDQIGLHEVAHLQRWDDYTNVFQKLVEALLFFNPAVYLIGRQLMLEREIACDDRVIAATGKPVTYAACLTRLVEVSGLARPALPALGALSARRQFAVRIERLLGKRVRVSAIAGRLAAAMAVVVVGAALLAAGRLDPLIAIASASDPAPARLVVASAMAADRDVAPYDTALAVHPPALIDFVTLQEQHAAAHAAVTAAARHVANELRQVAAEVRHLDHVARSNAVGARNFSWVTYQVIAKPMPTVSHSGQVNIRVDDGLSVPVAPVAVAVPIVGMAPMEGIVHVIHIHAIGKSHPRPHVPVAVMAPIVSVDPISSAAEGDAASADAAAQSLAVEALSQELQSAATIPEQIAVVEELARHIDTTAAREAIADAMLHNDAVAVKLSAVRALARDVARAETQCVLIDALAEDQPIAVQLAAAHALAPVASTPQVRAALEDAASSGARSDAVRATVQEALSQQRTQ